MTAPKRPTPMLGAPRQDPLMALRRAGWDEAGAASIRTPREGHRETIERHTLLMAEGCLSRDQHTALENLAHQMRHLPYATLCEQRTCERYHAACSAAETFWKEIES